jgi:hypothetical protein
MAYKMDRYLISRLNVANSEFCKNGIMRKIPHGDFEKLAGMNYDFLLPFLLILQVYINRYHKLKNFNQIEGK